MNNTIAESNLATPLDNTPNANMEQSETTLPRKLQIDTKSSQMPTVLDPDDSLMKKFQNALREHLIRVDNRLNSEILDLVSI